jgi:hypothetical protein
MESGSLHCEMRCTTSAPSECDRGIMNKTLERRLQQLERSASRDLEPRSDAAVKQALASLSDEELDHLENVAERGAALSECAPAEQAALRSYQNAYQTAAHDFRK